MVSGVCSLLKWRSVAASPGLAPSNSVCRTDVILFHHRALKKCRRQNEECRRSLLRGRKPRLLHSAFIILPWPTGCRGSIRTIIRAFKGRCPTVRRPGSWIGEPPRTRTGEGTGCSRPPRWLRHTAHEWGQRQDFHLHRPVYRTGPGAVPGTLAALALPSRSGLTSGSDRSGCWGWIRTNISVLNRHALDWLSYPAMVEPEVVATSPCRLKRPMPVCCGFDSVEMVPREGFPPPTSPF
jgi:hypothetical protein